MNDDLMFEYLLQMGALRPEQEEMRKKQATIDALRQSATEPMQGQMVGKHYVAPSPLGAVAKIAQGYMAGKMQTGQDESMRGFNNRQRKILEDMRNDRRRQYGQGGGMQSMSPSLYELPYGDGPVY